jgi:hypothetical protein
MNIFNRFKCFYAAFGMWLFVLTCIGSRADIGLASSNSLPKTGTYEGYIHFDGSATAVPASLDFLSKVQEDGQVGLIAFLKLEPGRPSHEYTVQYFEIPNYDWTDPNITLDAASQPEADLSFVDGLVSSDGLEIKGRVLSLSSGARQGKAHFVYVDGQEHGLDPTSIERFFPNVTQTVSLTGEYKGKCVHGTQQDDGYLQIEAIRKLNAGAGSFRGFEIRGRVLNHPDSVIELGFHSRSEYIVDGLARDGQWDIFHETLHFASIGLSCKTSGTKVECNNGCTYQKINYENSLRNILGGSSLKRHESQRSEQPFDMQFPMTSDDVAGNYRGYVTFDGRGESELITLEVYGSGKPIIAGQSNREQISIIGKFFLGCQNLKETNDFSAMRFRPAELPKKPVSEFVIQGHQDVVYRVTSWTKGAIEGTWYSKNFGRVGKFYVQKDSVFSFLEEEIPTKINNMSGLYASQKNLNYRYGHSLKLNIAPEVRRGGASLFPFEFFGELQTFRRGMVVREQVRDESYDPFTGVISLISSDSTRLMGRFVDGKLKVYETNFEMIGHEVIPGMAIREYVK